MLPALSCSAFSVCTHLRKEQNNESDCFGCSHLCSTQRLNECYFKFLCFAFQFGVYGMWLLLIYRPSFSDVSIDGKNIFLVQEANQKSDPEAASSQFSK